MTQTRNRLPIIDTAQATITISKAGQGYNPNRANIIIPASSISDQIYINDAITLLNSLGGGKIVLLDGVFIIDNTINMKSNVVIDGQGMFNTTIKIRDGINLTFNMITADAVSGCKISNIKLDGNLANRVGLNQYGIYFLNAANNIIIESVYFLNIYYNHAVIQNNSTYITFDKCIFSTTGNLASDIRIILGSNIFIKESIFLQSGRPYCIQINSLTRGIITDCYFTAGKFCIYGTASYSIITNNIFNNMETGFRIEGSYNNIKGNTFNNITTLYAIFINNGTNNCIIDNYINSAVEGIILGTSYNNVSNNYISSTTSNGIRSSYANNNINNNYLIDIQGYGIDLLSSYNKIDNNYVINAGLHGILLSGASNNSIIGNFIINSSQSLTNTYDNININFNSDDNNIQNNKCINTGGAAQPRYGINVSNANCDTNVVTNNDLKNSGATGSLNNAGTGTVTAAGNRL